eukprot:9049574-Alexandrium_andersonii.AAC.1
MSVGIDASLHEWLTSLPSQRSAYGVAVLRPWGFLDQRSNRVQESMVNAFRPEHKRSRPVRFMRHAFLCAWPLLEPDALVQGLSAVGGSDAELGSLFTRVAARLST